MGGSFRTFTPGLDGGPGLPGFQGPKGDFHILPGHISSEPIYKIEIEAICGSVDEQILYTVHCLHYLSYLDCYFITLAICRLIIIKSFSNRI